MVKRRKTLEAGGVSKVLQSLLQPLGAVLISLVLGAIIIAVSGEDVLNAYGIMLHGGFGNGNYLAATISRATPIIMGGLAVCVAWKAGYEAMGGEGQMILGALASALVALYVPGNGTVRIILAIAAAMLVGALYSAISGWLYQRFGVNFIISTLMMNYIANNVASYLTTYVVKDPEALDLNSVQTAKLPESVRLGKLAGGLPIHWGFVLAVLAVAAVFIVINYTAFGYKARMGGINERFARYGGINSKKMLFSIMLLSGALAGMGGAFEVLGSKYRYIDQMIFTAGFAWSGMVAALLANFNPFGTMFAAIMLAGLSNGGSAMQRSTEVPVEAVSVIEGIIMLLMSVKLLSVLRVRFKKRKAGDGNSPQNGGTCVEEMV